MGVDQRASRARILEGAVALLSSGQCADLTVEVLARSLRMSKGTLYRNFQSKDHILVALVMEACESAEAESDWARAGGTAAQQLTELAAVIERAAILGDGRRLAVRAAIGVMPAAAPAAAPADTERIMHALEKSRGRIEGPFGAAAALRVNPNTLRSRLRKLGIDWARYRNPKETLSP